MRPDVITLNGCLCASCVLDRWRKRERRRKLKPGSGDAIRNHDIDPRPNVKPNRGGRQGTGCPCARCVRRQKESVEWRAKNVGSSHGVSASGTRRSAAPLDDLDRKALQKWPEEWGQRA